MKFKLPSRRRALRWLIALVVIALVGIYVILPIGFAAYATMSASSPVDAPPAGFEEVTLTTRDDVALAGWYTPSDNGAAIVLLHGAGGSRDSLRDYATMLAGHGYGVMAIDMRGHGESEGDANGFNWHGTQDVSAAVDFLQEQDGVDVIGGLGLSLGGEALLGAVSEVPALRAVVSDGATYRSLDEYLALPWSRPIYRSLPTRVLFFAFERFTGDDPPLPLLDSMRATDATSFLFIAAGNDHLEVDYNELFAETLRDRSALWVVPDVGHTHGFRTYPDEYEQRVITFFDTTLLGQ